ncbi:DUF1292 domain-containing protein [Saccharibacillus sp. O23]|uniref:DUF1292 domain-containing protein n=1 Tax=Saccharibacillus sp. O23 TaxID=2009338 RepID=UPI000B417709|nr:DUF1292 domain-containing protein [Saccharibacillus sp. O23]OWA36560.1 DUF1292 domain-containing protein [Saccharibacillus sp. O16]OWR29359.1 DUF1292 domain-containing protein [Saccharibacillus sp. O23]
MTEFSASQVVYTNKLEQVYGLYVELIDENAESVTYRIVKEFEVGGGAYAVLQNETVGADDDVQILKIETSPSGEVQLSTIDDDDEWENVAELFDELTFPEEM